MYSFELLQVAEKMENMGRRDAETEVFLKKIIEKETYKDRALLKIVSEINDDEEKVYWFKTWTIHSF